MTAWATSNGCRDSFSLLDGIELADVAVGPDELQPTVAPAAELHPIGVVQITRH